MANVSNAPPSPTIPYKGLRTLWGKMFAKGAEEAPLTASEIGDGYDTLRDLLDDMLPEACEAYSTYAERLSLLRHQSYFAGQCSEYATPNQSARLMALQEIGRITVVEMQKRGYIDIRSQYLFDEGEGYMEKDGVCNPDLMNALSAYRQRFPATTGGGA